MFLLVLIGLTFVVSANAACQPIAPNPNAQSITNCVFPGYTLTDLAAVDLYGIEGNQQYVYRLCGAVRDTLCPANSVACKFGTNMSTCDTSPAVSVLNTDATHTLSYLANNPKLGIQITAVSPTSSCSNGQNTTVQTNIYCTGANVPDRLVSISKTDAGCLCIVTVNIYSQLACPNNVYKPQTVTPIPSRLSCRMGQFGIDLSTQFAQDLFFELPYHRLVMNLCGPSQDWACKTFSRGGQGSICLVPRCQNVSTNTLMFAHNIPTWYYTNHVDNTNGYTMINYNGPTSAVIIRLTCDINATSPVLTQFVQSAPGTHQYYINSSLACVNESANAVVLTQPRCTSGCCGLGMDFSPFKNVPIFATDSSGMPYLFQMCGPLLSPCGNASTCQKPTCGVGKGSTVISTFRPTVLYDTTWSYVNQIDFTGGLRLIVSNGDMCGAFPRTQEIVFLCDPRALYPVVSSISTSIQCIVSITVMTNFVCQPPKYLGGAANVGLRNTSATGKEIVSNFPQIFGCQFDGYDFSLLGQFDMNVQIYGWIFVTRICGMQTNPYCAGRINKNTSICQVAFDCNDRATGDWVLSVWNPFMSVWDYINEKSWQSGVRLTVATGDDCGGFPRTIVYNFVCDPNAVIPYHDIGFEAPGQFICNYFMRIRTNIVCKPPAWAVNNATYSSSSSSSTALRVYALSDRNTGSSLLDAKLFRTLALALVLCFLSTQL